MRKATPPGTFFDAYPLHLVSTNAMDALAKETGVVIQSERFRPNLVLNVASSAPYPEPGWLEARLLVGTAELEVCAGIFRCGMPAHAQSAALPKSPEIVRHIYGNHGSIFGVYARVIHPGPLAQGRRSGRAAERTRLLPFRHRSHRRIRKATSPRGLLEHLTRVGCCFLPTFEPM